MDAPTEKMFAGAVAGFTATVPMTLAMEAMHPRLPPDERYPLPPREITENVAEGAGVLHHLDEPRLRTLSVLAHFAYGAAAGGACAALLPKGKLSATAGGAAFGLALWAGSYLGLLPALGVLSPATQHPARRNALMIAAHVVWGAAFGLLLGEADGSR